MSNTSRAIAGYTLLLELAERRMSLDNAIALLEVPIGEADLSRARRLSLYPAEYERMRSDLGTALRQLRTASRGR